MFKSFNDECPICYDDLNKKIHFPFSCNHRICLECNDFLDNRHCPICRKEIPLKITRRQYLIFTLGLLFPPLLLLFLFEKKV